MSYEGFKRKLTAIFSADVAGYSRLMGDDEAATIEILEAYKEVMYTLIKQHRGRVVHSPGDNLLAEFDSVVDAVQCAVAVQKELQARNAALMEKRRMHFRIGINLGDVIEEQGRIYGDGVNIAARLEALADPGGICISKMVFDHIETKLPLGYDYIGEQRVKNIVKGVAAYKVLMEPRVVAGTKEKSQKTHLWRRRRVLVGTIVVFLILVQVAFWKFYLGVPEVMPPSGGKTASSMPEEKSLAVLPFDNLSGDSGEDFLSDGLTEDLITALSGIPRLLIIARNSSFTYKGKPVNVRQVGEELGVRYILEGSIQTEPGRVRITAQLIDAATGNHLWAERYDRELKDIFSLQDEITLNIVRALQVTVGEADRHTTAKRAPKSLDAYLKVLKGKAHFLSPTPADNAKARKLFEEAILLDPDYPVAYALLARTYLREVWLGWSKGSREPLQKALDLAENALALDPSDAASHALLSQIYLFQGLYEKAMAEAERGVSLSPGSVDGYISLGMSLYFAGQYQEAVRAYKEAMRLDPTLPAGLLYQLGNAYLMMEQYKEAEAAYRQALARNPKSLWAHVGMAAMYSMSGKEKEARETAEKVLEANPFFSLRHFEEISPYRNIPDKERLMNALRKAGLGGKNGGPGM
jgi:adenylate cyclase